MLIGGQDPLMEHIMDESEAITTEEERECVLIIQKEIEDMGECNS